MRRARARRAAEPAVATPVPHLANTEPHPASTEHPRASMALPLSLTKAALSESISRVCDRRRRWLNSISKAHSSRPDSVDTPAVRPVPAPRTELPSKSSGGHKAKETRRNSEIYWWSMVPGPHAKTTSSGEQTRYHATRQCRL